MLSNAKDATVHSFVHHKNGKSSVFSFLTQLSSLPSAKKSPLSVIVGSEMLACVVAVRHELVGEN